MKPIPIFLSAFVMLHSSFAAQPLAPMLNLPDTGGDADKIDFANLPVLKGEHAPVTLGDPEWKFRLHNYLAYHDGQYWCTWSHGPVIEDNPTQHVRYATSPDGLNWSEDKMVMPSSPREGFRYIARGLWVRDGKLLCIASHDEAFNEKGRVHFFGKSLQLLAWEWQPDTQNWKELGVMMDDAINNFPPSKMPNGEYGMLRRDHERKVSMMFGGVASPLDWKAVPLSAYTAADGFRPEEPDWWTLPDGRLLGMFRDNARSYRFYRAVSADNGRTWTQPEKTNFPDATSKFFCLRTSRGFYALVSNANPKQRNPLCLSTSDDGVTFTRMAALPIPQTLTEAPEYRTRMKSTHNETFQYPHVIEQDGHLLIAFARRKQTIEVVKVSLDEIETLRQSTSISVAASAPHPVTNPGSPLMLAGDWVPEDTHRLDFDHLPKIPSQHVVVNDVLPQNGHRVNQHNYLVHHAGRFWAMWSDGPGESRGAGKVPGHDLADQHVGFASSPDGLTWGQPGNLTGRPDKGYGWIARGFWEREGKLLALASRYKATGFAGPGLSLHAFELTSTEPAQWTHLGLVHDDTLNNFSPILLPSGEWMMNRRDGKRAVHFLRGGVKAFNDWRSTPMMSYTEDGLTAEEPDWWVLPDGNLCALFRDNAGSGNLFRAFSTDEGRTWTKPVRTNFPDAKSKFSALRLKDGRYVLVSNPKPKKRDPLTLAISDDGLVFHTMGYLAGGRHVDYPHVIEHDDSLFIAFATAKQTVEVLKVKLADVDAVKMPEKPLAAHPAIRKREFIYDTGPYPQIHASSIVETPAGLVAAWFGGTREKHPDVCIWVSRLVAGKWTESVEAAHGAQADGTRHPTWNPVLFQPREGPLMLFYKVGPDPRTWWGELKTSSDGGITWSAAQRLPHGIFGPIKNKPVQLANGDILCPTSNESDEKPSKWAIYFERSSDLGKTWTRTGLLHDGIAIQAIQPSLLHLGGDRLQAVGRTRQGKVFQIISEDAGKTWGKISLSELPNPNSGTDAITLADGRHLLVYNHTTKGRSPLNLAVSKDGKNWEAALVLEDDPGREFSYPAIIQTSDGLVHITYTWRRKKVKHVVVDPSKLTLKPITNGQWPE